VNATGGVIIDNVRTINSQLLAEGGSVQDNLNLVNTFLGGNGAIVNNTLFLRSGPPNSLGTISPDGDLGTINTDLTAATRNCRGITDTYSDVTNGLAQLISAIQSLATGSTSTGRPGIGIWNGAAFVVFDPSAIQPPATLAGIIDAMIRAYHE
jgi:hypothetical protein